MNQGMKQEVSPLVMIGVGVVVVVLLVFFAVRSLAPHPAEVTIPPPALQNEGAAKRHNILQAQKAGQSSAPSATAGGGPDRTGQ